jgi:hypothetical protein
MRITSHLYFNKCIVIFVFSAMPKLELDDLDVAVASARETAGGLELTNLVALFEAAQEDSNLRSYVSSDLPAEGTAQIKEEPNEQLQERPARIEHQNAQLLSELMSVVTVQQQQLEEQKEQNAQTQQQQQQLQMLLQSAQLQMQQQPQVQAAHVQAQQQPAASAAAHVQAQAAPFIDWADGGAAWDPWLGDGSGSADGADGCSWSGDGADGSWSADGAWDPSWSAASSSDPSGSAASSSAAADVVSRLSLYFLACALIEFNIISST